MHEGNGSRYSLWQILKQCTLQEVTQRSRPHSAFAVRIVVVSVRILCQDAPADRGRCIIPRACQRSEQAPSLLFGLFLFIHAAVKPM